MDSVNMISQRRTKTMSTTMQVKCLYSNKTPSMFLVVVALVQLMTTLLLTSVTATQYVAPGDCHWEHIYPNHLDIKLSCKTRIIGFNGLNFSLIQTDHTVGLLVACDDQYDESRLEPGSMSHLRYLKSFEITNCRLNELRGGAFRSLTQLRNLTIRTGNEIYTGRSLRLNHESLAHVRSLEQLDLGFNNMAELPTDLFCPLSALTILNLTHNQVGDFLSLGVVDHMSGHLCLQELQQLDLSNNRIAKLAETGVASLKNLQALYLQYNQIEQIDELSLSALKKLQAIDLSNNQLSYIPARLFRESIELRDLNLDNNSLSVLPGGLFKGLSKLAILRLGHNHIGSESILSSTFDDLIRVVILDLSHNQLKSVNSIFENLYSLQILYLDNNEIADINDNAFSSLYNLHSLILTDNHLKSIGPDTFKYLYVLNKLLIDSNMINYIDPVAFKNCTHLNELNLSNNMLDNVPESLLNLKNLKKLDLSNNVISNFAALQTVGSANLLELNLSRNLMEELQRSYFKEMSSLKVLDVSWNRIAKSEAFLFEDVKTLEELYMNNNNMKDINGMLSYLERLRYVDLGHNQLSWFDLTFVADSVEEVYLNDNKIDVWGNYFVKEKRNLRKLDLRFNRITDFEPKTVPYGIETLLLSNNNIKSLSQFSFAGRSNLALVDLRNNSLVGVDRNKLIIDAKTKDNGSVPIFYMSSNPYYCDCTMEWLQNVNSENTDETPRIADLDNIECKLTFNKHGSHVSLTKANSSNFLCKYSSHCFALCHCCEFDACDCEMMCPDRCTCYYDQTWNTNIVDCSNQEFHQIPQSIPMDVTELYMDGNDLQALPSHKFIGRKNMKALYLNSSQVQSISNRTFNGLTYLQQLHLEHNQLTTLNGYEFDSLAYLKELYLDHNRISHIANNTFIHLRELKVLMLHHNHIVDFQVWNVHYNVKLQTLALSLNKWTCSCNFVEQFKNWIHHHGIAFVSDYASIQCFNKSSEVGFLLHNVNTSSCNDLYANSPDKPWGSDNPQGNPDGYFSPKIVQDYLPYLLVSVLLFLLLVTALVLFCVFRKEFKVWLYTKYGVSCFHGSRYAPETEKLFDAFVSYCKKDEAFIAQILAPELECGHPPYRLCLRYRDLPMTGYITEFITEAIESSHRTVILLSEQFLKSDSCRFELKVAHHECQVNKSHQMVVVVLDKNSMSELDSDVKLCLRSASVINWGDKRFWEKLRYSMPQRRGQKPMNCPDVRASIDFKRAVNMNVNNV